MLVKGTSSLVRDIFLFDFVQIMAEKSINLRLIDLYLFLLPLTKLGILEQLILEWSNKVMLECKLNQQQFSIEKERLEVGKFEFQKEIKVENI